MKASPEYSMRTHCVLLAIAFPGLGNSFLAPAPVSYLRAPCSSASRKRFRSVSYISREADGTLAPGDVQDDIHAAQRRFKDVARNAEVNFYGKLFPKHFQPVFWPLLAQNKMAHLDLFSTHYNSIPVNFTTLYTHVVLLPLSSQSVYLYELHPQIPSSVVHSSFRPRMFVSHDQRLNCYDAIMYTKIGQALPGGIVSFSLIINVLFALDTAVTKDLPFVSNDSTEAVVRALYAGVPAFVAGGLASKKHGNGKKGLQ